MDNIIVKFTADASGIKPGVDGLTQAKVIDAEIAEQAKKTTAAIQARDKAVSDSGQASRKSMDSLYTSVQNIEKAIIGGNFSKVFVDLNKNVKTLEATMGEFKAGVDSSKKSIKELGDTQDVAGGKTQTLKARLRELKQELALIDDPSDPKFRAMSIEAAELEDRISDVNQQIRLLSSDTRNFDASIQAVQGIAGAFAVAQGAAALFGADEQEVQQALLKVNAAMSILQGLQQIGALLDKNSALNIFLLKTLRLQQAASTTAVAVAEGEATVATEALAVADTQATVAQEGLNVAMAANPAGVLILALGTLIGLIKIFVGDTEAAAKAQEHLNNSFQEGLKTNDGFIDAIKNSRDLNKAELEKGNASAATIRQNDILSLQEQIKQTKAYEDSKYQVYVDADNKLRAFAARGKNLNENDKREKDAAESIVNSFSDLQRKRFALENQLEIEQLGNEKATFQERLKNHTAFVEASVLQTKAGSREELVAQIAAIRAKEQEDLLSEAKLPGEIAQIRAQANRAAQQVRTQIRVFDLNQEKLYTDARLQKSIEGSQQELSARINLLRINANIEIAQAQGNSAKILDIKLKEKRDEFELVRSANRKIADDELNARTAAIGSDISKLTLLRADATNEQLLEAKEKLIEAEAQKERLAVDRSIDTAENKIIRLEAINDKELADKVQLEKDKSKAEIDQNAAYFGAFYQLQIDRAERVIDNDNSSYSKRKQALKNFYEYSLEQIQQQQEDAEAYYQLGIINYTEYQTKLLELTDKTEALKTQKIRAAEAERQEMQDRAWQLASTFADGYFQVIEAGYQNDLSQTQSLASQKLITQKQADKQSRDIKKKEAIAEKENALFQIAITTAQNIIKDHGNILKIAFDIAAGIAQTAFVVSRPLPAYKTGIIGVDGPGTETSDSILARLSKGESVMTAGETKKYRPYLEAMREDRFEHFLATITLPEMPYSNFSVPVVPKEWQTTATHAPSIDYDLLGQSFAKHVGILSDIPAMDVRIDENGISVIAKKGLDRTQFLNKKFSFK